MEQEKQIETRPIRAASQEEEVMLAKYILSSDIPASERRKFTEMSMLFNKEYALANIERTDIPYYQLSFEFVVLLMEVGLYRYAREIMAEMNQELKLTRAVDGLQLKVGFTGVSRSETVSRIEEQQRRRKLRERLSFKAGKAFKGNEGGDFE